jgi:ferredoxin
MQKISKVVVDRGACIGATTCVVVAPNAFDLDKQGVAVVKPEALKLDFDTLLKAAQSCPTQAILLFDEQGNQIFPKVK